MSVSAPSGINGNGHKIPGTPEDPGAVMNRWVEKQEGKVNAEERNAFSQ